MQTGTTQRKTKQGTVIRRSGDKSVIVEVARMAQHPRFKKYVRRRRRFHVDDPANTCRVGDVVLIRESRPLSATKHWQYVETVQPGIGE